MGCCSSKKTEPKAAAKKAAGNGAAAGKVNKGFEQERKATLPPRIEVTPAAAFDTPAHTVKNLTASAEEALERSENLEAALDKIVAEEMKDDKETSPEEIIAAKESSDSGLVGSEEGGQGEDVLDDVGSYSGSDEMDGIRLPSDIEGYDILVPRPDTFPSMEPEPEAPQLPPVAPDETLQAVAVAAGAAAAAKARERQLMGSSLSSQSSKSRKFSQIQPGAIDSPQAVKVSSKFTMIPTGNHDQEDGGLAASPDERFPSHLPSTHKHMTGPSLATSAIVEEDEEEEESD